MKKDRTKTGLSVVYQKIKKSAIKHTVHYGTYAQIQNSFVSISCEYSEWYIESELWPLVYSDSIASVAGTIWITQLEIINWKRSN